MKSILLINVIIFFNMSLINVTILKLVKVPPNKGQLLCVILNDFYENGVRL